MKQTLLYATLLILGRGFAVGEASNVGQLAELTASDGAANDYFGTSIATSGNIVVVGAPGANSDKGAVYVFIKPASGWSNMKQVLELTSPNSGEGDAFGSSVAVSGNTIAVGAPGHYLGRNQRTGAAYVAKLTGHGVTQMAELTASDAADAENFGQSVAVDGTTVAVGASGHNNFQGAAYLFTEPAMGWVNMTQTAELTPSTDVAQQMGATISVSGNTLVAGAWNDNGLAGAAYLFVEPGGGWVNATQTAELTASDGQPSDDFARSSLSLNGNVVVVGAECAHYGTRMCGPGVVYVFVEPPAGWTDMTETAQLTASDGLDGDGFGSSVSTGGSAILVGAFAATVNGYVHQGTAYVYVEPKSGWRTTSDFYAKLTASDGAAGDEFGVSASSSGNTGVVGATGANDYQGEAYVFGRP